MLSFKSKLAVITGAASGIGRALAFALGKEGAVLALADINAQELNAVKEELEKAGVTSVLSHVLDVADEAAWQDFAATIETQLGMADLLFNNAGISRIGRFEHTSSDAFAKVMDINYWGVVYGTRAFLPQIKLRQGAFINISSLFGLVGVPGNAHYCSSKFAVRGFNESIRQEFADFGVHVASVHPGGVNTNIVKSADFDEGAEHREALLGRLHENALTMPPEKAASIILEGLRRKKHRILVGNDAKFMSFVQRLLPSSYPSILRRLTKPDESLAPEAGPIVANLTAPSLRSRLLSKLIRLTFKKKFSDTDKEWDLVKLRNGMAGKIIPRVPKGIVTEDVDVSINETITLKGQWQWPSDVQCDHTVLYLHGGGYAFCSVKTHSNMTMSWAKQAGAKLFSLEYRLAPEHPYPAALEDALAAYQWLLDQGIEASKIVMAGDSAGGGLSAALLLKLKELKLPQPAGAILLSPWVDLAATGASLDANTDSCAFFTGDMIRKGYELYAPDEDLENPFVSPLYGDLSGLAPLRIYVGSTEALEDDGLRFYAKAAAAGVDVELRVWNDQPHAWPVLAPFVPEASAVVSEMAEYSRQKTSGAAAGSEAARNEVTSELSNKDVQPSAGVCATEVSAVEGGI